MKKSQNIFNDNHVSMSIMIDKNPTRDSDFKTIQSRSLDMWIEDNSVTECFECKKSFGLLSRKSHCRYCGRIFCSSCCNKLCIIPIYIKVPNPPPNYKKENRTKDPVKVCIVCYNKLQNHQQMERIEKRLDIFKLKELTENSSDWIEKQWANFTLSSFREIHYFLPDHRFSQEEKDLLWENRLYFIGHNKWIVQLLKSINYESVSEEVLNEINFIIEKCKLLKNKVECQYTCTDLMCTRSCNVELNTECAIQLLTQAIRYNPVREYALSSLNKCSEEELECFVPYLLLHALYSPIVQKWLLDRCKNSELIANELFWELQTCMFSNGELSMSGARNKDVILEFLAEWKQVVPIKVREKIENSTQLIEVLKELELCKNDKKKMEEILINFGNKSFYFPTNISNGPFHIDPKKIVIYDSVTCPVAFHMVESEGKPQLFKPADIRKEQHIMNIIRMMKFVLLRDENLDLPILTYPIRPISCSSGFVEMVTSCIPLAKLRESGMNILAWIIEQNADSKESGHALRERFVESCAAYSVITYLLLVEDRHLDNMLLKSDGSLFHIDYGFVLGQDPKQMLNKPKIRISHEMVSALGGINSITYKRHNELCSKIYNCLRRNINLFICMSKMFVDAYPSIKDNGQLNEEKMLYEIKRRFMPGESSQEAEIQIYNHIYNSSQPNFSFTLLDSLHSARTSVYYSSTRVIDMGSYMVGALWYAVGLEHKTDSYNNNSQEDNDNKK